MAEPVQHHISDNHRLKMECGLEQFLCYDTISECEADAGFGNSSPVGESHWRQCDETTCGKMYARFPTKQMTTNDTEQWQTHDSRYDINI